jgi:uncharacterized protein (TIGR02246 family)
MIQATARREAQQWKNVAGGLSPPETAQHSSTRFGFPMRETTTEITTWEETMRVNYHPTINTAGVAVTVTLLLAGSIACSDRPSVNDRFTSPQVPISHASLSSIPTDGILEIVSGRMAAWAVKDPGTYASAFATDVQFINPTGALVIGREAFRTAHVFLFNGPFAGSTLTLAVRDIKFLTGTVAIVYLDLAITGYAFLPPGLPSPSDGVARARVTWVVEKQQGDWQIVFMQNTAQQ